MSVIDLILGRPLTLAQEGEQKVGPMGGVPIFGLDALSSAAYGPEAALTILIPLGTVGLGYIVPISASIIVLLTIVYFSYRQTIAAYPAGGGSYTVAHQNLGARAGLLAAGRDSSLGLASSCCSCANTQPLTPRNNDSVDTLTTLDQIFIGFISFDHLQ